MGKARTRIPPSGRADPTKRKSPCRLTGALLLYLVQNYTVVDPSSTIVLTVNDAALYASRIPLAVASWDVV
jgi:hypothetical protein